MTISPPEESDRGAKAAAALAAVWERFRDATLRKVGVIEEATVALLEDHLSPGQRQQAEREAHKLAGSCGTFGFPRSSQLARDIETKLSSEAPTALDAVFISEQLVAMRQDLAGQPRPAFSSGETVGGGEESPTLLLVALDSVSSERITSEAEARGFRSMIAESVAMAKGLFRKERASAALIRFDGSSDNTELLDFIRELEGGEPRVPTLVLTSGVNFEDRVEIARRGATRFLDHGTPPRGVVDALMAALHRGHAVSAKVLVVDQDADFLRTLETLLEPHGMEVVALNDPRRFWEVLQKVRPDLLILELEMPHINGPELCRVVRNDREWCELPVVFLSTRTDAVSVGNAFAAGCDDYIGKALIGAELVLRLDNRLQRIQLHRARAGTEGLTGVYDRKRSVELIERLLRLAQRKSDPYSLAILEVNGFAELKENHGHEAAGIVLREVARLLAKSFRAEDVIGRLSRGGQDFAIGMYGSDKEQAAAKLSHVVAGLSQSEFSSNDGARFRITLTGGVAQYPTDGETVEALRQAATAALARAKADGAATVVQAGAQLPGSSSLRVDVALVDDDEALVGLLRHSLESRGLTVATFPDGESAVEAMTGDVPRVCAMVILLDVDLPALNGLQVLRRFNTAGLTRTTSVVMLTARSGEGDVLTALDLGAIDHISKPFSVPVLIRKVESALRHSRQ